MEQGNCEMNDARLVKANGFVIGLAAVSHFRGVHLVAHASTSSLPLQAPREDRIEKRADVAPN